jgi:sulfate adenylyltransferase
MTIKPHGGKLIDLLCKPEEKDDLLARAGKMKQSVMSEREIADFELMSYGVYSPISGFMTKADYDNVVENMRLASGLPWSLPIMHAVSTDFAADIKVGDEVALTYGGKTHGILKVAEKFTYDKKNEAEKVYRTTDEAHPGVAYVYGQGDVYLGGDVVAIELPECEEAFKPNMKTPAETRAFIAENGWERIVAFQTRNPVHRAHEYLLKVALEMTDALFIHPLVGATKKGDIPADVRMDCYNALLKDYFPKGRAHLTVFPAAMRYAGPREAIFHALCRKNYGFTHFIVGRDHAGVGTYYGTYDAQKIFSNFSKEEMDITPLFFEHSFFCSECNGMASDKTCVHGKESRTFLSGTKVREMLQAGTDLPVEFTRPEISEILVEASKHSEF